MFLSRRKRDTPAGQPQDRRVDQDLQVPAGPAVLATVGVGGVKDHADDLLFDAPLDQVFPHQLILVHSLAGGALGDSKELDGLLCLNPREVDTPPLEHGSPFKCEGLAVPVNNYLVWTNKLVYHLLDPLDSLLLALVAGCGLTVH